MRYLLAAVGGCGLLCVNATLYDDVAGLVNKHGYDLRAPLGSGWEVFPETNLAVNSLFAWASIKRSPPPLVSAPNLDADLLECTQIECRLNTKTIAESQNTDSYKLLKILDALVAVYDEKSKNLVDATNEKISSNAFAALENTRACEVDADCTAHGTDYTCCDKPSSNVPGICCEQTEMGMYDAEVPTWIIVFFMIGAAIILIGWLGRTFKIFAKIVAAWKK